MRDYLLQAVRKRLTQLDFQMFPAPGSALSLLGRIDIRPATLPKRPGSRPLGR